MLINTQLKIATFNLFNYLAPPNAFYEFERIYTTEQWAKKQRWITNYLNEYQPDVIGFQEVFSTDSLELLVEQVGYKYFAVVDEPEVVDDFIYKRPVVAIASRYPITAVARVEHDADYDAFLIKIGDGDQFSSGFVNVNPNSKIPALMDHSTSPTTRVFESGAILQYLAEKFDALIPDDHTSKTECRNWLFWQMGSAPYLGGGFGHFYAYAPYKMQYPIDRFTMEVKRQLDVLNRHLSDHDYMAGSEYSIADIAIWPWYGSLVLGDLYDASEFLDVESYTHVMRWAKQIARRPAVKRGRRVNRTWGDEDEQLAERHSSKDF